jgi:hypothetical protein
MKTIEQFLTSDWECLKSQQGADVSEFSIYTRHFYAGLPGVSQGKVTQ